MNDEFEARVAAWLRERARPDPTALSAVLGTIETLPARHRARRRGWLLAAAAVLAVVAVGLSSVVLSPRPDGFAPTGPSRPAPPDPAAFAGDPRLKLCGSSPQGLLAVFEMAHLSDYQRHLPNAYPLIGLAVDPPTPALVAVYAGPPSDGRQPLLATSSPGPNDHDLCIVAGKDSESWVQIGVVDVDTTGVIAVLPVDAGPTSSSALSPRPPDPAAYAGDPRLAACLSAAGPVAFAFEMPHARDYRRHFPAMLLAPELDVDDPAFAVVFAAGAQLLVVGHGASASPDSATSPRPNERSVCILVGSVPNLYENVDISGMQVDLGGDATDSPPPR